ncbi:MAG: putative pit accessory protein [Elusimicrobia bacterium ADurb.Bin231]|nr:MAG: putative pit accessory protein [Elusimicrobia bacterium ADurb.Bin231]
MEKRKFWEKLFPKRKDFFQMLANQTSKVEEGLMALVDFMEKPDTGNVNRVNQLEEEADELRRILIDELNRTFVTPIDREDIFTLSRACDDIMDYAKSTVEEMRLFEITPNIYMKKMVEALHNAAKDINCSVKNLQVYPGVCAEHLVRTKKAENFVEHKYREALVDLFKTNDVIQIMKTREIYRHLSNAADRAAEAADIISDILVKNT